MAVIVVAMDAILLTRSVSEGESHNGGTFESCFQVRCRRDTRPRLHFGLIHPWRSLGTSVSNSSGQKLYAKQSIVLMSTESELPHPIRRNVVWLALQYLMRLAFMIWVRYQCRGLENLPRHGGGLILVNHQSFLDPMLVGLPLQRPVSYLARDTLFPIPIVGWILRKTYVMPINRDSASTSSIREAMRRMEHGFLVGIFPEGTRCEDGSVGEFKPGFVTFIRRSNLPVYPVGIAGAHEAMPRGGLRFLPRRVRVVFGPPLDRAKLDELSAKGRETELVSFARDAVVACQQVAEEWRQAR